MTDLRNFVSAGYYLTQPIERDWQDEKTQAMIPDRVLSLSSCVSPTIPDTAWEHQNDKFGLDQDILTEMNTYFAEAHTQQKIGYPSTWYNLADARDFLVKFGQYLPDVVILGRGIHPNLVSVLQEEAHEHYDSMKRSNFGVHGIYECILANQAIYINGKILGYEVIGIGLGLEHSMYCYNLIDDFHELFEALPNQFGFYDDFELAKQCGEKASQFYDNGDPVGDCYWYPLLVVKYDW